MSDQGPEIYIADITECAVEEIAYLKALAQHRVITEKQGNGGDVEQQQRVHTRILERDIAERRHDYQDGRPSYLKASFNGAGAINGYIHFCAYGTGLETGIINDLYVHPDSWREGVGQKLFENAVETLRQDGFTKVVLTTAVDELRPNAFYRKMGGAKQSDNDVLAEYYFDIT